MRVLATDAPAARDAAGRALALVGAVTAPGPQDSGPLAAVRREAMAQAATARLVRARADSRTGRHDDGAGGARGRTRRASGRRAAARRPAAQRGRRARPRRRRWRATSSYRPRPRASGSAPTPAAVLQRVHARAAGRWTARCARACATTPTSLLGRDDDIRRAARAGRPSARVVSIVGPGGLGKTRLAHVLGRDGRRSRWCTSSSWSASPSPDDVVGEVGSALGRPRLGQRSPDPHPGAARRRARPDRAAARPGADACWCSTTASTSSTRSPTWSPSWWRPRRDLRVVTTTRAPLAIAAERVYPLGRARPGRRAPSCSASARTAARPGVHLDRTEVVRRRGRRLDGLPLAIELAAAKVRAMSVERHRPAPRRPVRAAARRRPQRPRPAPDAARGHRLVVEPARRAASGGRCAGCRSSTTASRSTRGRRRCSATDALDVVQRARRPVAAERHARATAAALPDARDRPRVRPAAARRRRRGRRRPARAHAGVGGGLRAPARPGPVRAAPVRRRSTRSRAEETNLADVLRAGARRAATPARVVRLLATLGSFWTIRGEHARVLALAGAIADAVAGWTPPPELVDVTRAALVVTLINTMVAVDGERTEPLRELLRAARARATSRGSPAMVTRDAAPTTAADGDAFAARLERRRRDPDRARGARSRCQWPSHVLRERRRRRRGAVDAAERGARAGRAATTGRGSAAMLHTQLGQLTMQLGDAGTAERARAARRCRCCERLGAPTTRSSCARCSRSARSPPERARAEAELSELDGIERRRRDVRRDRLVLRLGAGRARAGPRRDRRRAARLPPGASRSARAAPSRGAGDRPGAVGALRRSPRRSTAHAHHARPTRTTPDGERLFAALPRAGLRPCSTAANPFIDYPVAGLALFALGAWGLLREAMPAGDAVALLVARRAVRLQPDRARRWRGSGSRRTAEERAPGADRGDPGRVRRPPRRPSCSTRRAALVEQLSGRGDRPSDPSACSCAPTAARRPRRPRRTPSSAQPTWR